MHMYIADIHIDLLVYDIFPHCGAEGQQFGDLDTEFDIWDSMCLIHSFKNSISRNERSLVNKW